MMSIKNCITHLITNSFSILFSLATSFSKQFTARHQKQLTPEDFFKSESVAVQHHVIPSNEVISGSPHDFPPEKLHRKLDD
jgi:hypothetical protein